MTKKIFNFIVLPVLFLICAALILELGFTARAWFESLSVAKSDATKTQVLFMGDSILGFLKDPASVPHQLSTSIQQTAANQFEFQELSAPALRTSQALRKLKELLRSTSPDLVILMLGKSDYLQESSPALTSLSRFRTFRLLEASYWDLHQRWLRWTHSELMHQQDEAQIAWDLKEDRKYAEALPIFERALLGGYDQERVIRGLHESYLQTQQYDKALQFFKYYKDKSKHKLLIDSYLPVFAKLAENAGAVEDASKHLAKHAQNRDHLRTLLWLAQQQKNAEEFATLYNEAPPEFSSQLNATSRNNLLDILALLKDAKAQVLLLQYPMDHASALTAILPTNLDHVQIIDTREILKKASATELMNFWREDMEHINEQGSAFLAIELQPYVLKTRKGL